MPPLPLRSKSDFKAMENFLREETNKECVVSCLFYSAVPAHYFFLFIFNLSHEHGGIFSVRITPFATEDLLLWGQTGKNGKRSQARFTKARMLNFSTLGSSYQECTVPEYFCLTGAFAVVYGIGWRPEGYNQSRNEGCYVERVGAVVQLGWQSTQDGVLHHCFVFGC